MSNTRSPLVPLLAAGCLVLLLGLAATPRPALASDGFPLNVGAGLGIPYGGGVGATAEVELPMGSGASLAPSVAAGHTILADFGWDVGIKALFLDENAAFRVGIAAYYGTNLLIEDPWGGWHSDEGVSAGITGRIQLGAKRLHCIDVYVIYPFTTFDEGYYEEQGTKIKVAVGYVLRLR
jgi:hypothetical protein